MKFEEVLPALREGKKITNRAIRLSGYEYIYYKDGAVFDDKGRYSFLASVEIVENDNWEIVKEPKKVKLRDLTEEQFKKFCEKQKCESCLFCFLACAAKDERSWLYHKEFFNDKFLDQEIEIEEELDDE